LSTWPQADSLAWPPSGSLLPLTGRLPGGWCFQTSQPRTQCTRSCRRTPCRTPYCTNCICRFLNCLGTSLVRIVCSWIRPMRPGTCLVHTLRTRSSPPCLCNNPCRTGSSRFVQPHLDTDPQGILYRRWQLSTSKCPQGMEHTRYFRYPPCKSLVGTRCNQAPCKSPCSRGGRGCSLFCRCLSPNRTRRQSRSGFGGMSCSTRPDMERTCCDSCTIPRDTSHTCRIYRSP